jgi:glycosyltransferase involved in cell wall biosynthesis
MTTVAVSVIVTAFNSEAYLADALASIAHQEFRDYEIIVVDDGSDTDKSERICRRFNLESGIAVRYVYQNNRGPSGARNHGIRLAAGEFVAFLDADDLFCACKLSVQVAMIRELPASYACVIGGAERFKDGKLESRLRTAPTAVDGGMDVDAFLRGDVRIEGTPAYLFRGSALEAVEGFDESLRQNEDFDLLFRLSRRYLIKTHRDIVFLQRMRADSLSKSDPLKALLNVLRFASKVERLFVDVAEEAIARQRQRAYFVAARMYLMRGGARDSVWLMNRGLEEPCGLPSMRAKVVYLGARGLKWLGRRPDGL